jgi:hypothetical protein
MADYTFNYLVEPLKNDSTIQKVLDIDALAAPAKAALAGYVASLGLPIEKTQHLLWENVGVAVLIQQLSLIYYLPSLGSQTPAPNLKRTSTMKDKVIEMQSLESKFPKCQMLIFGKNAADPNWIWLNTETIQNSGNRVNTLKLVPYISQSDSFIPGRGAQIGIQFIADPVSNATLPQAGDRLTVSASVAMDVNPIGDADSKKNNVEADLAEVAQLESRLAALETLLQPFGAATATASGTTGLVRGAAAGESEFLLRGDRTWQSPAAFVRTIGEQVVESLKTFSDILTGQKTIRSTGSGNLSNNFSQSQAALFSVGGGGYISLSSAPAPSNLRIVDFGMNAQGECSLRRLNDAYNSIVSTLLTFDASHNLKLNNFTNLGGNVAVKATLITGTIPTAQGAAVGIPTGIDSSKIIAIFPFASFDANGKMPPGFKSLPNHEYECYIDNDQVIFRTPTTNTSILLGKPCSCLIVYTN